jgi:hypothetical protein
MHIFRRDSGDKGRLRDETIEEREGKEGEARRRDKDETRSAAVMKQEISESVEPLRNRMPSTVGRGEEGNTRCMGEKERMPAPRIMLPEVELEVLLSAREQVVVLWTLIVHAPVTLQIYSSFSLFFPSRLHAFTPLSLSSLGFIYVTSTYHCTGFTRQIGAADVQAVAAVARRRQSGPQNAERSTKRTPDKHPCASCAAGSGLRVAKL